MDHLCAQVGELSCESIRLAYLRRGQFEFGTVRAISGPPSDKRAPMETSQPACATMMIQLAQVHSDARTDRQASLKRAMSRQS